MEIVSAPMFTRMQPAIFCVFERVTKEVAIGDAKQSTISIPASSTDSIKLFR
jgi:hypothetical protein